MDSNCNSSCNLAIALLGLLIIILLLRFYYLNRPNNETFTSHPGNNMNNHKKILSSISKALSKNFKKKIKNLKNPYESKINVNKITKILIKLSKSKKLIKKRFIDVKR